jgi:hypothetical protein
MRHDRMVDIVKDLREYPDKYPGPAASELEEFGAGHYLLSAARFHVFLKRLRGGMVQRVSYSHTAAGRRAVAADDEEQGTEPEGPGGQ